MIPLGIMIFVILGVVSTIIITSEWDGNEGLLIIVFMLCLLFFGIIGTMIMSEGIGNVVQEQKENIANKIGNGEFEVELYKTEISQTDTTYFYRKVEETK